MTSSPPAAEPAAAYVSEAKIYPRDVTGRLQRLRHAAVIWLLGMFYLFPWLHWDGRQAVLFDLPARKFHVFGLTFWPQDFLFLAMLLIIAALSLFFFTALAGRLWCGYACPQTVWTEVFLLIERWTEGDRDRAHEAGCRALDREEAPAQGQQARAVAAVLALWTGFTFVGFFTPIRDLAMRICALRLGRLGNLLGAVLRLRHLGQCRLPARAGVQVHVPLRALPERDVRPQHADHRLRPDARRAARPAQARPRQRAAARRAACSTRSPPTTTCSAPACTRRPPRRAPRPAAPSPSTRHRPSRCRSSRPTQLGDCVDCTICVQVCPTGIDIRNGLQYECIACGACIDGCNEVMDKLGYPHGLIRYSTQNAIDGKPTRVLRPRIVVYGLLLALLAAAWAGASLHRSPFIAEVLRDRNALYRVLGDGSVENAYTLKIVNKTDQAVQFAVIAGRGAGRGALRRCAGAASKRRPATCCRSRCESRRPQTRMAAANWNWKSGPRRQLTVVRPGRRGWKAASSRRASATSAKSVETAASDEHGRACR